jgi:DNA-binding NarL/FixJ family response regulator
VPLPLPHLHRAARDASVLVVDDHALVRAGLCTLLRATPGLSVVGEALDVAGACAAARAHAPDVVLVNERALDADGVRALPRLRLEAPRACVLVMGDGAAARDSGAHGCLPPDAGIDQLCSAVAAHLGGACGVCAVRPWCAVPRVAATLTPRERQVAVRVAAGLTSRAIAELLGLSRRTVDTYRESIARKLGASSPAAVTRYVIESGMREAVASPEY